MIPLFSVCPVRKTNLRKTLPCPWSTTQFLFVGKVPKRAFEKSGIAFTSSWPREAQVPPAELVAWRQLYQSDCLGEGAALSGMRHGLVPCQYFKYHPKFPPSQRKKGKTLYGEGSKTHCTSMLACKLPGQEHFLRWRKGALAACKSHQESKHFITQQTLATGPMLRNSTQRAGITGG